MKESKDDQKLSPKVQPNSVLASAFDEKLEHRELLELTLSKDQKRALQERLKAKEQTHQKPKSGDSSNLLVVFHSAFEQLIRNRSNSESLHNYEEKWTACFITQFICRWETMIALFELPLLRLRLTLISENQNKA